jgi:hypothetical protein
MATGQSISMTKSIVLIGVGVLLMSLVAGVLTDTVQQPTPLGQQEPISAPIPLESLPTSPVPAPAVTAPIVAKPKTVTSAPHQAMAAKPAPAKSATVAALSTPETPKPKTITPSPKKAVAVKPEPAKSAASATESSRPAPKQVTPPPMVEEITEPKRAETGYRKLGRDGTILPDDVTEWACVQDRATGLIWEVKTDDNSIRDRDNFYTWYDRTNARNFGHTGARNGGRCKGEADCDTLAYIQAINRQQLCGFADWRLPLKNELLSLVEYNYGSKQTKATINLEYFPHSVPSWYWTASTNEKRPDYAWFVLFRNGLALNALKEQPKHVRLVRGYNASGDGQNKSDTQYLAQLTK